MALNASVDWKSRNQVDEEKSTKRSLISCAIYEQTGKMRRFKSLFTKQFIQSGAITFVHRMEKLTIFIGQ